MQKLASYVITEHQVEAAAPNTLLSQPPPPSVTVCYRNYEMSISRAQGLTFGAVVAELDALREKCRKKINELVKRPCTLANRREYARNMEVLGGPGHGDVHGVVPPSQWIGLEVENAEDEYSEPVCVAREARCLQTSWEKPAWASSVTPGPDLKEFENLNFNFEHRGMEGTGAVEWRGIARKAFLGSKFSHRACGS
jgi:hypothetical protein